MYCAVGTKTPVDLFTALNVTNPFILSHVIACVHTHTVQIADVYATLRNPLKKQLARGVAVSPLCTNTFITWKCYAHRGRSTSPCSSHSLLH
jgi:hypothetical protein